MGRKIDLKGQRFNRLLVIEEVGKTNGRRITWKCLCDCGNETIVRGSDLKNDHTRSCGCYNSEQVSKRMKNKTISKETRKKMSKAKLGKSFSEEHKKKLSRRRFGENNPMFGIRKFGKNNPNYNPYITDEERKIKRNYPEYIEWRKQVYERDNYTCQVCKDNKGNNLIAHHIENYRNNLELRTTLENGITMCTSCHINFHHQYGYSNNTIEQFEEFLKERKNGKTLY